MEMYCTYRQGGWRAELPTHGLLPWFCGGLSVASEPGTRPDPRFGRRRFRLSCHRLVGRVPVLASTGVAGLICPVLAEAGVSRVRRPAGACHPSTMKGTAMTIVEDRRAITGGVDTHADVHVAAALDPIGGLLGVQEFPRPPQPDTLTCWNGWASSGLSPWSASRAPAVTARAWPGTWPVPASGSWRWTAPTGRTGTGRASPTRWMRSAPRGPRSPAGHRARRRAATGRWRRSGR
jgi:hypothetical protein